MKRVLRQLEEDWFHPHTSLEYLPYEEGITPHKGDRSVAPTFSLPLK